MHSALSALAPSDTPRVPRVGPFICSLLAIIGGCPSAGILSVASAVFHVAFEGAAQSYTSLPSCSIASKATMLTADEGRDPGKNRGATMRLEMRPGFTRQPCSIVNSCIMAAGSIFISLGLHSSSTLFWFRQRGDEAPSEKFAESSPRPVKMPSNSSAPGAKR
jgi:hypothetical protein